MLFFIIVEAFDLRDVFLFLLDNVGISTYYRKMIATTLFTPSTTPKTSSMVLVIFFTSLALFGGRLLRYLPLDTSAERVSIDLVFSESFSSFLIGLFP